MTSPIPFCIQSWSKLFAFSSRSFGCRCCSGLLSFRRTTSKNAGNDETQQGERDEAFLHIAFIMLVFLQIAILFVKKILKSETCSGSNELKFEEYAVVS